jgi:high affinity Mn2+ porin
MRIGGGLRLVHMLFHLLCGSGPDRNLLPPQLPANPASPCKLISPVMARLKYYCNIVFLSCGVARFETAMPENYKNFAVPRVLTGLLGCLLCAAAGADPVEAMPSSQAADMVATAPETWAAYGQATLVSQSHGSFASPYQAANSLYPGSEIATTTDLTLFLGARLPAGGELWANPEIDQGFGLSNTEGMAGFPSGEAYKVGANRPYPRLPRLFYRQTINLGGEAQAVAQSANQLSGTRTDDNIILTVGKFSVVDVFDTNAYAHDPRSDFFNWAVVESGAFDYAADSWGFTKGASAEWTQSRWTLRGGFFTLSQTPNTTILDQTFHQHEWVAELEQRHQWGEHLGKIKLLGFVNQGNFGSYADALQQVAGTHNAPDTALVRRYSSRPGIALNLEQEVTSDLGAFARASLNNGTKEADDFTEINRSLSGGVSLKGDRWGRHDDTAGAAFAANGLSSNARAYFAAGGIGILIGDGHLNYATEKILEGYYAYAAPAIEHLTLTLDYQYIVNPAYNQDRGPVSIFGLRAHKEF